MPDVGTVNSVNNRPGVGFMSPGEGTRGLSNILMDEHAAKD
jgi:hypothetical protein